MLNLARQSVEPTPSHEVDNIADLRGKMPELRDNVISGKSLPEVYAYPDVQ